MAPPDDPPREPVDRDRLVEDIRAGRMSDLEFDQMLAPELRVLSRIHWSPMAVCARAAVLLGSAPGTKVLDVGCGPGKLCAVAATLSTAEFTGIDQRAGLIGQASAISQSLGASRARFVVGDVFDLDWNDYRSLYFYNPFGELELTEYGGIDALTAPNAAELEQRLSTTSDRLAKMPLGSRVVAFHGIGCQVPRSYSLLASEWVADGPLQLWVQTAQAFRQHRRVLTS